MGIGVVSLKTRLAFIFIVVFLVRAELSDR